MNLSSSWSLLAVVAAIAVAQSGCFSPGCHNENRTHSVELNPATSCLQLDVVGDQNGPLNCDGAFRLGGVNNCPDTLSLLAFGGEPDGGVPDAGPQYIPDGGSPLGPNVSTYPPGSSINELLELTDQPDGSETAAIPAALGNQSLLIRVTLGPQK